ncbi:hypothetical protein Trydic_g20661 [Trypoxylus dichotomus]
MIDMFPSMQSNKPCCKKEKAVRKIVRFIHDAPMQQQPVLKQKGTENDRGMKAAFPISTPHKTNDAQNYEH